MPKVWTRLRGRPGASAPPAPQADVLVIVLAGSDWEPAARLVRETKSAQTGPEVQIRVVAAGLSPADLAEMRASVRRSVGLLEVEGPASPTGPADPVEAARRGAAEVDAPVVVVLTPPLDLLDGWLAPLVSALDDPAVLGAQPLLRARDGSLAAAGPAFGSDGVPHAFLTGFPLEDASVLRARPVAALSGPVVAVRRSDLLEAATPGNAVGADIGAVLAWTDFTLRLRTARAGTFRVCPESSVVVRDEPAAATPTELSAFAARWAGAVPDGAELWAAAGFELAEYDGDRPRVTRRALTQVREGVPQLRWAIKNPATALSWGERWGDTHFARRLAEALRRAGQQVVIDHRQAFGRETGYLDDVELLLRGLTPHRSSTSAVRLLWVISHPDEVTAAEVAGFDRVFAASTTWAAERSREWSIAVEPLLQATDPTLFHPDRAPADSGHDLVFVGSAREGSRPIVTLARTAGLPLAVYGADWDGQLPEGMWQAPYVANDAVGAIYRAAGVVLNDHWDDMRAAGFISNRLFDAAAVGARVVTDDVPGLDGLFGRSVQVARTSSDLAHLAGAGDRDAIFGNDAERRAVAARVHAEHSFDVRAERLLAAALELRARR